jgi:hypothetical protein
MKASKFSDAQKAFILKQGNDGVPVLQPITNRVRVVRSNTCCNVIGTLPIAG